MNPGERRKCHGFTMVEVMVAMALVGIIIVAIYACWFAVLHGAKAASEAAAAVQRSRIAVRTLEEALTSAQSFAADIEYYGFTAENGMNASLSFVSRLSKSFPRSGKFGDFDVRRITFSVERGPDSDKQLVLRQNPILMDWDIDEREHPIVLAKHVRKFELEFWDTRTKDWVDEWTQTNQLPALVRVLLQLEGAKLHAPPQEEVVRVVSLPAITVQAGWQTPGLPGAQPGRGPNPNLPGQRGQFPPNRGIQGNPQR